jgi:hypothetical protein
VCVSAVPDFSRRGRLCNNNNDGGSLVMGRHQRCRELFVHRGEFPQFRGSLVRTLRTTMRRIQKGMYFN